jgi:DTW domain-containing protein YfiP
LADAACPACLKPPAICVCDRTVPLETRARILILQHPQEQDFVLGSARLALLSLPAARLAVGLSWASLAKAWGAEVDRSRWAVLYPSSLPRPLSAQEKGQPWVLLEPRGRTASPASIDGLVLLDGSWSQAKALWWRNPWLLKLGRLVLHPREPSIYGKLRREPRLEYLSTLEAIALALEALGEPPETRETLRRLFRTMVQRARDAGRPGGP